MKDIIVVNTNTGKKEKFPTKKQLKNWGITRKEWHNLSVEEIILEDRKKK